MIAEAKKNYRGVLCNRCGASVPVPQKAVELREELGRGEREAGRSFAVRCRVCEHEGVYSTAEIREFDGDPPMRFARRRAATA